MRKTDIDLSVEYCETAPLAYGVEPHTTPWKIKFLSLEPSTWVTEWEVVDIKPADPALGERGKPRWQHDKKRTWTTTVQQARMLAHTTERDRYSFPRANDLKVGDTFITYDADLRGFLQVLRWKEGQGWTEGLAAPAAVHRSWSTFQAERGEAKAKAAAHAEALAPGQFTQAVATAIAKAVIMNPDADRQALALMVEAEAKRQLDLL